MRDNDQPAATWRHAAASIRLLGAVMCVCLCYAAYHRICDLCRQLIVQRIHTRECQTGECDGEGETGEGGGKHGTIGPPTQQTHMMASCIVASEHAQCTSTCDAHTMLPTTVRTIRDMRCRVWSRWRGGDGDDVGEDRNQRVYQ